jgi:tetratricopeptide (TPR) repeat protein
MRLFVVGALVAFAPPPLAAKDKPTPKSIRQANLKFKKGIQMVEQGRYELALVLFNEAYEKAPHPLVLFNIAGTHRHLKQYRLALDAYRRFLVEGDDKVEAALLRRGKQELDMVLALVAQVSVSSQPSGALITIDGEEQGMTPLSEVVVLTPGRHTLEASLSGHESVSQELNVKASESRQLQIVLEPLKKVETEVAIEEQHYSNTEAPLIRATPRPSRFSASAAYGANLRNLSNTGAALVGASVVVHERISLGLDFVFPTYALIPRARLRLAGNEFALHAVVAAPISFSTDTTPTFVAGGGGAGIHYRVHSQVALRAEVLVTYAGKTYGLAAPAFAGAEVVF